MYWQYRQYMGYNPLVVWCLPLADLHHLRLTKRFPKTPSATSWSECHPHFASIRLSLTLSLIVSIEIWYPILNGIYYTQTDTVLCNDLPFNCHNKCKTIAWNQLSFRYSVYVIIPFQCTMHLNPTTTGTSLKESFQNTFTIGEYISPTNVIRHISGKRCYLILLK